MTKGRYAAKAANRAAALDNEVIAELRTRLKGVEAERDQLACELHDVRADFHARVIRTVAENTAGERVELQSQLASERRDMQEAMNDAAEEVADVLMVVFRALHEKYGQEAAIFPKTITNRISEEGPSLLRVFDLLCRSRTGEFMEAIMTLDGEIFPYKNHRPGEARQRRRRDAHDIDKDMAYWDERRKKKVLTKKYATAVTRNGDEQEA